MPTHGGLGFDRQLSELIHPPDSDLYVAQAVDAGKRCVRLVCVISKPQTEA